MKLLRIVKDEKSLANKLYAVGVQLEKFAFKPIPQMTDYEKRQCRVELNSLYNMLNAIDRNLGR